MVRHICGVCALLFVVVSCKTGQLQQLAQNNTTQQVPLGSVGLDKDFILQSGFHGAALPRYQEPIKVSPMVAPFTKQTYKLFLKAQSGQGASIENNYTDSLALKPQYIQLAITDKVALIEALNHNINASVKDYLGNSKFTNIVTSISIAFNQSDLVKIQQADAVFLIEKGLKTYALQLYKNGAKTDLLHFNTGVIFAYKTSNCCWQENKRHQLGIVDIVDGFNGCPNNTYRSANRAKKKVDYLKL